MPNVNSELLAELKSSAIKLLQHGTLVVVQQLELWPISYYKPETRVGIQLSKCPTPGAIKVSYLFFGVRISLAR